MLRASHRVLKPGGTTAFFVIAVSDDTTEADHGEAVAAGPPRVDTDVAYPDLMDAAGFDRVDVVDVTPEFAETLTAWRREWRAAAAELRLIVGADEFAQRQANRTRAITAVQAGWLRRFLISGRRT